MNANTIAIGQTAAASQYNDLLEDVVNNGGDFQATTGSGNTYVLAINGVVGALVDGLKLRIKANHSNTGASTINVNGLGAKAIVNSSGSPLGSGDLTINRNYDIVYNSNDDKFYSTGVSIGVGVVDSIAYDIQSRPTDVTIDGVLNEIAYNASGQISTISIGGTVYTVTRDQQQRITSII